MWVILSQCVNRVVFRWLISYRAGRTGRAGRKGLVTALVTKRDIVLSEAIKVWRTPFPPSTAGGRQTKLVVLIIIIISLVAIGRAMLSLLLGYEIILMTSHLDLHGVDLFALVYDC